MIWIEFHKIKYLLILEIFLLTVYVVLDLIPFIILLTLIIIIPIIYFSFENPIVGLLILLFSILAGSLGVVKTGGKTPPILFVDLFFPLIAFLFFIKTLQRLFDDIKIPKIIWLWGLFLIWSLLSFLVAVDVFRAILIWKSYFAGFICFTIAYYSLKDSDHIRSILVGIIIWGLVLSLIEFKIILDLGGLSSGLIGLFFKKNLLATSWGRSNYLATFFVIIIPISIGILLVSKSKRLKLLTILALTFMATAMILTLSRGGLLALIIGLFVLFSRVIKTKTLVPIIIALLIVTLIVLLNPLTYVLIERLSTFEKSLSYFSRLNFYEDVWLTFLQYPITGVGLGNLGYYAVFIIPTHASAHNIILGLLGETGIIGAILFSAILIMVFKVFVQKYRIEKNESLKILRWSFISSYIGVLIHSMMEPNFEGFQFSIMFWILVAVYYKLDLLINEDNSFSSQNRLAV